IDGGDGNDRLVAPDTPNKWNLAGADAGALNDTTLFSAIENLTGGSAADAFNVTTFESISGQIDGAGGTDTLTGPDVANTWTLTGAGAGTLDGPTDFAGIENLTGGNADDTFQIHAGGSLAGVLDGGPVDDTAPTVNSLDYSTYGSAVSADLQAGSANGLPSFAHVTRVVGSGGVDTLTGPVALNDQTSWTVTGTNAGVVDGTAFAGFEN